MALDNKKKETRSGLRSRGPLDTKSEDTHACSTHDGEEADEEEEKDSLQARKRVSREGGEEGLPPRASKKPYKRKVDCLDARPDSDEEVGAALHRTLRVKPPAQRYGFYSLVLTELF